MKLSSMRYKNYTWPHNPKTFVVEYRRQIAAQKVPMGGCVLQDLGVNCRILRGEGEFAGPDAYEEFEALADVFRQEGPGMLVHPVWRTDRAYFVSLSVTEEPKPGTPAIDDAPTVQFPPVNGSAAPGSGFSFDLGDLKFGRNYKGKE